MRRTLQAGDRRERAADIVYTDLFTGVHGNYLSASIVNAGLDPDNSRGNRSTDEVRLGRLGQAKAWRDIWGSGQGIGVIDRVRPAGEFIDALPSNMPRQSAALASLAWPPSPRSSRPISARAGLCGARSRIALVDTLDPRVKVGARADQPLADSGSWSTTAGSLSCAWPSRRSGRRPSDRPISPDSIARWVSSRATMCMISGRHLQGLAGEANAGERVQSRAIVAADVVEIVARFIGEQHRLGVKRVDKARRNAHLLLRKDPTRPLPTKVPSFTSSGNAQVRSPAAHFARIVPPRDKLGDDVGDIRSADQLDRGP
jgi:hypothetical protein